MAARVYVQPPRQGNRQKGYDRDLRQMAPLLLAAQAKGYISASHIAEALRDTSVRTKKGKPFAESVIFNMLRRAHALGIPVERRSRSEAASERASKPRRPRHS